MIKFRLMLLHIIAVLGILFASSQFIVLHHMDTHWFWLSAVLAAATGMLLPRFEEL